MPPYSQVAALGQRQPALDLSTSTVILTNAMFTNIEGEWDEVMAVVKRAVEVAGEGSARVGLVLKADIRPGHSGQLKSKVDRVEEYLSMERAD